MDKIIVLDFGSQTAQLISRRIREIGIYSEVLPGDINIKDVDITGIKGIILSGSPESVYDKDAYFVDKTIYTLGIPLLGICYGLQRITVDFNGKVTALEKNEYGRSNIKYVSKSKLFENVPENFNSWMSHGDSIEKPGDGFEVIALSDHHIAAVYNKSNNIYGIQFHPEVTHCEHGNKILENFTANICGAKKEWNMELYLEDVRKNIINQVKDKDVLLLISGGVDSTVVAALLLKSLNPEKVHLMYINTGLMRKNESTEVENNLKKLGAKYFHHINASRKFLEALKGITDPETKRKIIGDLFITVQQEELKKAGIPNNALLAQGTLYTDLIESGKGVGKKAHVIKSHHNVKSPLVEEKRERGEIIEPLDKLYKDEVRELGKIVGISDEIIGRHPFPGPGLAVRILGEVTEEKCDLLREADYIYISELKKRGLYNKIWQAFPILLPIRSVGVTGDTRKYGHVLALRAITSIDGMTADVFPMNIKDLLEISSLITNSIPGIGRVVYDVSSKPPATIEWE
ncbi:MAG: glutamine-hydrolyzing GMP synthase [Spirochaetaceae bacterium]|nr:glutamine-hydrolyzing GMP synthase [Spirochaetaceae bacterium]